jgi:hypothetical protein
MYINVPRLVNNLNLSVVTPYVGGSAVKAMYRFHGGASNEANCLKDLTPNRNDLIKMGSPVWLAGAGVQVNTANGFLTPINETPSLTYVAIVRPSTNANGLRAIVGNFRTAAPSRGSALSFILDATNVTERLISRAKPSTGTENVVNYRDIRSLAVSTFNQYRVIGASLNATTQEAVTYAFNATTGIVTPTTTLINTGTFASDGISGRKLTETDNVTPLKMGIGYTEQGSQYTEFSDVLEIIICDTTIANALNELTQQLQYSKAFWATKGIILTL